MVEEEEEEEEEMSDSREGRSCFIYRQATSLPSYDASKSAITRMLHFGDNGVCQHYNASYSSSSSSTSTCTINSSNSKTSRKNPEDEGREANTNPTKCRRQKKESSPSVKTIKVRKDKLGDKITELQQLVSPFGKSDTASVLHEALCYIRFLHDQVQVLSSPYMKCLPSSVHLQEARLSDDLQRRGLCLVPVSCTENLANDTGTDFWPPSIGSYLSISPKH